MTAKLIGLELVLLVFLAMTAHAVGTLGYIGFFDAMGANAATRPSLAADAELMTKDAARIAALSR